MSDKPFKRIIICSDGTWNKPGNTYKGHPTRTNVQKIFEAICNSARDGTKQIKYYDEGVGSSGSLWKRTLEGAIGNGIEENIIDLYKFIIWNYEVGDEIYLFGFSRGAYTARSLAGLIRTAGLVKNNDLKLIKKAYSLYQDRNKKSKRPDGEIATQFRIQNSQPDVRIKFIGVWDTVGSLGIPNSLLQIFSRKYEFHDTELSSSVDFAYQALALDEQRKNFQPSLWEQNKKVRQNNISQTLEQVWFPGVHSNIGGGYPDEGLSDISLSWMVSKAHTSGLDFEVSYIDANIKPNPLGQIYDSNSGIFSILKKFVRPVLKGRFTCEKLHESVCERLARVKDYEPINLESKPLNSQDIQFGNLFGEGILS